MSLLNSLLRVTAFRIAIGIGLAFAALHWATNARLVTLAPLATLELVLYDLKFQLRGPILQSAEEKRRKKVVIAAADEASIRRLGRLPWSRVQHARLLDRLMARGARVVAFDMTFADDAREDNRWEFRELRDQARGLQLAEAGDAGRSIVAELERRATQRSADEQFATALRDAGDAVIMGYIAYHPDDRGVPSEEEARRGVALAARQALGAVTHGLPERDPDWVPVQGPSAVPRLVPEPPVPLVADAAGSVGFFVTLPDADGTLRRNPLVAWVEGPSTGTSAPTRTLVPSLALASVLAYHRMPPASVRALSSLPDRIQLEQLLVRRLDGEGRLVTQEIPVGPGGELHVNLHGPDRSFEYVSIADVLDDEESLDPDVFKDRVVLVGATAIGTFDQRVTVYEDFSPGVEFHAAAIDNILEGRFIQRPNELKTFELLALLALAALTGFVFSRAGPAQSFAAYAGIGAGVFALDYGLFLAGFRVVSALPQLQLLVTFLCLVTYRFLGESREKLQLRTAFRHYLDDSVVAEVLKAPDKLKLGGDKVELSVLFTDIRGFTTLSEKLAPEQLVSILNQYLTPMTDIVFQNGGTLDKYIGDAIMCFFGAPVRQDDHALRACRTALQMLEALEPLQRGWREAGLPELDIGLGINTGPMVVGNMGSAMRFDYTVIGDHVNLASRLEGTTKEYGTRLIISEFTLAQVQGRVGVRELGSVRVVGKRQPVKIFELLSIGAVPEAQRPFVDAFHEGLRLRHPERRFAEAAAAFERALALRPGDTAAARYHAECRLLEATPPPEGWDGVSELRKK